jgi:hypothetical protein
LTRKGKITEGIRAETGIEYQLLLAVERLEAECAEREAATHERLTSLSKQVNALAEQVNALSDLLQRMVPR